MIEIQAQRAETHRALEPGQRRLKAIICAALFLAAAAVFIRLAAPDTGWGDTPELLTAAYVLGVPHTTGYPLFTALTKLTGALPAPGFAFGANIFWALVLGLAAALLYILTADAARSHLAGAFSALMLIISPAAISMSMAVEVYALNALLMIAALALLMRWRRSPEPDFRLLGLIGLLAALGMAHHGLFAFVLAAAVYLALERHSELMGDAAGLLALVFIMAVGAMVVIYLPLAAARSPAWNWGLADEPSRLLGLLSGRNFREFETSFPIIQGNLLEVGRSLLGNPILLLAGLIGIPTALKHSRDLGISLLFIGLGAAVFSSMYMTPEKLEFSFPALMALAVFGGFGIAKLVDLTAAAAEFAARRKRLSMLAAGLPRLVAALAVGGAALLAFLPLLRFAWPDAAVKPSCAASLAALALLTAIGALGGVRTQTQRDRIHGAFRLGVYALTLGLGLFASGMPAARMLAAAMLTLFAVRGAWLALVKLEPLMRPEAFLARFRGLTASLGARGYGLALGAALLLAALFHPGLSALRNAEMITTPLNLAVDILEAQEDDAIFFVEWDGDPYAVFRYAQVVWGVKPRIAVAHRFMLGFPWYLEHLDAVARANNQDYFTATLEGIQRDRYRRFDAHGAADEIIRRNLEQAVPVNFNLIDLEYLTDNFFNSAEAGSRQYRFLDHSHNVTPRYRYTPQPGHFAVFRAGSEDWKQEMPRISLTARDLAEPVSRHARLAYETAVGQYYEDNSRRYHAMFTELQTHVATRFGRPSQLTDSQLQMLPELHGFMETVKSIIIFDALKDFRPSPSFARHRIFEIDSLLATPGVMSLEMGQILLFLKSEFMAWSRADGIESPNNELTSPRNRDPIGLLITPEAQLYTRIRAAHLALNRLLEYRPEDPELAEAVMDATTLMAFWGAELGDIHAGLSFGGELDMITAISRAEPLVQELFERLPAIDALYDAIGNYIERDLTDRHARIEEKLRAGQISDSLAEVQRNLLTLRRNALRHAEFAALKLLSTIRNLPPHDAHRIIVHPQLAITERLALASATISDYIHAQEYETPFTFRLRALNKHVSNLAGYITHWREIDMAIRLMEEEILIPAFELDRRPTRRTGRVLSLLTDNIMAVFDNYNTFRAGHFLNNAYHTYTRVLELDPDFVRARFLRGSLTRRAGATEESIFDLSLVIKLLEDSHAANSHELATKYYIMGLAYRGLDFHRQFQDYWMKAANLRGAERFLPTPTESRDEHADVDEFIP